MSFFSKHPLTRKIAIVSVIKLCGLMLLWWFFFSAPAEHELTTEQVSNAILHPVSRISTTP